MRLKQLGMLNLVIASLGQLFCWIYVNFERGNVTPLGAIVFTITWNLTPYILSILLVFLNPKLRGLNVLSCVCVAGLFLVYWDGLLKPEKSTAGIALVLWPAWHIGCLIVIAAMISAIVAIKARKG
jgi:hypothetical protein